MIVIYNKMKFFQICLFLGVTQAVNKGFTTKAVEGCVTDADCNLIFKVTSGWKCNAESQCVPDEATGAPECTKDQECWTLKAGDRKWFCNPLDVCEIETHFCADNSDCLFATKSTKYFCNKASSRCRA